MVVKPAGTLVAAALIVGSLFAASILAPTGARAIEVKKDLYNRSGPSGPSASGPARENPIPAAQRQELGETVANESETYVDEESENKASGKTYVDIEHAKLMYLPTMKDGKWTVLAKLQGNEYAPSKSGKSKPTGKQRVLIFNYRLDGSKWTEVEPPKWQDVDNGATAAAKK